MIRILNVVNLFIKSKLLLVLALITVGCENNSAQNRVSSSSKSRQANNFIENKNLVLAPDFTLANLDGERVSMNQYKGKVVLLNFWGTWCGPCRKEIPDFVKLSDKYKKQGLEIVGITLTSGSPEKINTFAGKWGINYALLTDIEGNETQLVTALYGQATGKQITGIPTTFLIDRDGYIRQKYVGPRSEEVFYKDLKPYL